MSIIQTNSIWIVENERQLQSLCYLKSNLHYKEVTLQSDCEIQTLPSYDMVFFLITATQIGNRFFIDALNEILRIRKNSKTIFLAIDEYYRLSEDEVSKVLLELKTAVKPLISQPTIFLVSSYYAELAFRYEKKDLTLEELQRNRELRFLDAEGEWVTGRTITHQHLSYLYEISRIDSLVDLNQSFSEGIKSTGIDVTKKNWLVVGPQQSGRSTVTELLQNQLGESVSVMESLSEQSRVEDYYDGLILVLDLDRYRSLEYLEEIYSTYVGLEKIILVNKIDHFMYEYNSQSLLTMEVTKDIRRYTSDPIYFISAYYFREYLKLQNEEISIEEIIENPEIILVDSSNYPISKERNKRKLPELLLTHSGFQPLLLNWE
ncbi:hypothetical protein [Neobacillus sp. PS2-9]|uniref:hypothetical protein n=1 Tax=Neobacillus sp. PS2-9 TaxID=3070676 RepID=UPI0027E10B8B|nr:hypothetical protein [Neobacillus sp. PS2-9]WML58657.1 hypothetical protein RCG25_02360 [Neobacillus sp. PS2-9]